MSEKRFKQFGLWIIDDPNSNVNSIADLIDTKLMSTNEVVDLLNEQQATIEQLNLAIDDLLSHTSCDEIKKENEQLRTQLLICQQSKSDDGRFQVWQVPPIKKGMRIISFTTSDGERDE